MAKRPLFIPTADGPRTVQGEVMYLHLGTDKVKTFVHEWRGETVVAHYASGYRIGSLGGIKLARYVADGFTQLTDREAAQAILDKIQPAVWDRAIADKPILNH